MFSAIDYLVFSCVLLLSVLIGVYFGVSGKSQTAHEYLLGGQTMRRIPIIFSLIATSLTGITLLALPADVYLFGANYGWICISIIIVCIMGCYLYLPVLLKLKDPSIFEYISLRFNKKVKILASVLFTVQVIIYNPVVAYIPAIALSQVTGINVCLISVGVCIICIFYTAVGGFKAVVWTDTIQFVCIIASIISILSLGVVSVGGFADVWEKAIRGNRLELDFSLNVTIRDGFWPILLGGTVFWSNVICFSPGNFQKLISLSTLSRARTATVWSCCALIITHIFCIFTGLIVYAKYEKCDPLLTGDLIRSDQILPYFVMDLSRNIPGLAGIFISGIFSGTLSTLSSFFNALAATVYGDFLQPFLPSDISENRENAILKTIVVVFGLVCTILTLFVERLGGVLPYAIASQGLINGIFVGLFSLGMLFPMTNSKGAFWGTVTSFFVVTPIVAINQWYKLQGVDTFAKPRSTAECGVPFNFTTPRSFATSEQPFILFRLSYWYNALMSAGLVIVIGLIVSCVTKKDKMFIDPDLISPVSQFLIVKDKRHKRSSSYNTMDKALEILIATKTNEGIILVKK